jgi:catechol 2,3-dioxygenase-like lactoylglutathione lyase family enzyme
MEDTKMRHIVEITYFTHHIAEMTAFYQIFLEMEPAAKSDGMTSFLTGAVKLHLHAAYTPEAGELPPSDHVAVAVRDVDAACKALSEQGLEVEIPTREYDWGVSAYLRDPDGHQVELHQASVDWSNAHRFFSAACYNQTWDLLDKKERSREEEEQMVALAFASIYHWRQRPDCTDQNLAIGYWQASRVYAVIGQAENARRCGQLSLEYSQNALPFYTGYAYEALARAEFVAGNRAQALGYLEQARLIAAKLTDPEELELLDADLKQLESM